MCYTVDASIRAFLINATACAVLFFTKRSREAKILAGFFFFVGFMQLWDALLWTHPNGTRENLFATRGAMIFNHLQPIVLAVLIGLTKLKRESSWIILLYIVLIIPYSVRSWQAVKGTAPGPGGSLVWEWNRQPNAGPVYAVFLIALCVLFAQNISRPVGIFAAILSAVSMWWSHLAYSKQSSTGRFWCYFASFAPLLIIPLVQ